jgi:hypothetical protein
MERFCLEYYRTGNAYKSASAAGYKGSGRKASSVATRVLKYPQVVKRLAELRKTEEDAAIADVIERKKILTEVVRGRVSQFTNGKRISVNVDDLNSAAVAEVTTSELKLGRGEDAPTAEITKLKLRDPIAAIAELNKMDGIYKNEDTGNTINNYNVNVDKVLIDARGKLESIINRIASRAGEGEATKQPERQGSGSTPL